MRLEPFTSSRPSVLGGSGAKVTGSTMRAATPGMRVADGAGLIAGLRVLAGGEIGDVDGHHR